MNAIAKHDAAPEAVQLPVVTPLTMIERAIEKGADVAMIEKLMELQERNDRNLGRRAFDAAIAAAKAEIPPIFKNRKVDFTSSKGRTNYAHEDLAEIARTVDPILSRYGLSYRYRTSQDQRVLTVTCILSHRDGYSEETTLNGAADESGNKNHIQAIGSAATYLQRYTLKLALGLAASDDDDGRTAEKVETISADQFFAMQGLIDATGTDPEKFAQYLKVENLETLTLGQFDTAMAALRHKQKQAGAK